MSQQINGQTIFISASQGKAPPFMFFQALDASAQIIHIKQIQDFLSWALDSITKFSLT